MTANFADAPFDPEADAVIPLAEGESEYVYHDPRIVYAVNVAGRVQLAAATGTWRSFTDAMDKLLGSHGEEAA